MSLCHIGGKTATVKHRQAKRGAILTLAAAAVGGVAVETGDAALAVSARRQVLALLAHALVDALAVAVALTRWITNAHTKGNHTHVSPSPQTGRRIFSQRAEKKPRETRRSCTHEAKQMMLAE